MRSTLCDVHFRLYNPQENKSFQVSLLPSSPLNEPVDSHQVPAYTYLHTSCVTPTNQPTLQIYNPVHRISQHFPAFAQHWNKQAKPERHIRLDLQQSFHPSSAAGAAASSHTRPSLRSHSYRRELDQATFIRIDPSMVGRVGRWPSVKTRQDRTVSAHHQLT
jgi:hypothetical protein